MADEQEGVQYEWRCKDCDAKEIATTQGFAHLLKHQKGHHIHLVDVTSGQEIATSLSNARAKGIDIPGPVKEADGGPAERVLVVSQGTAKVTVTLPVEVWAMYNAAADYKKRPADQPFDEWLADCITIAFNVGYGLQFGLVPYEIDDQSGDGAHLEKEGAGRK
jgi:hypothetical protein